MTKEISTGTLPERDPELLRAMSERTQRSPGTGLLVEKTEILLLIDNDIKRFPLVDTARWILGRFEDADHPDQLDLSKYNALDKGVSRFHLQLLIEKERLFATDLNSTNGTYLSGDLLPPNKSVIVHNGDTLLLGRLSIQVLFR